MKGLAPLSLGPGVVHVWRVDLHRLSDQRPDLELLLSPAELQRADRCIGPTVRDRFALVRGALRHLAGGYLGQDPARVELAAEPWGRPYIPGSDVFFSVSHANQWALIAFARGRRVGVDLAWLDEPVDTSAVARFLPGIRADADRRECWQAWTLEEARRKTAGGGFAAPLPPEAMTWHFQMLEMDAGRAGPPDPPILGAPGGRALPKPADEYVASLVCEGPAVPTVSSHDFGL